MLERGLDEPGRAGALIEELNELVVAELEHGVEAMLGARELLHALKQRGTPIGLVSNSPLVFVQRSLEIVGFDDSFDVVISAHEVAAPKPAPDPYLEACRQLGVEPGPDVVALEDSPTGVAAARAAGLTVIGIPSLEGILLEEAHHIAESLQDANVLYFLVDAPRRQHYRDTSKKLSGTPTRMPSNPARGDVGAAPAHKFPPAQ